MLIWINQYLSENWKYGWSFVELLMEEVYESERREDKANWHGVFRYLDGAIYEGYWDD